MYNSIPEITPTSRLHRSTLPCDWEWRGLPWMRRHPGQKMHFFDFLVYWNQCNDALLLTAHRNPILSHFFCYFSSFPWSRQLLFFFSSFGYFACQQPPTLPVILAL